MDYASVSQGSGGHVMVVMLQGIHFYIILQCINGFILMTTLYKHIFKLMKG